MITRLPPEKEGVVTARLLFALSESNTDLVCRPAEFQSLPFWSSIEAAICNPGELYFSAIIGQHRNIGREIDINQFAIWLLKNHFYVSIFSQQGTFSQLIGNMDNHGLY